MTSPFIRNHQYNAIKKQTGLLQNACGTVSDPNVVQSVRESVQLAILEMFPEAVEWQRTLLDQVGTLHTANEFQHYLASLEPCRMEFAPVTEQQFKKLFPKNKKLKLPDLSVMDRRAVTYLGWTDIATNKLFLVYPLDGRLVGIEGRFTPANKKSVCFLCNRHEEVALYSAVTQTKPAHASPDYYKAIGNYLCVNSNVCNQNITDVQALEKFVRAIVGK